jgi:hypothetical protein
MILIDRQAGEVVRIGAQTLRVLAVHRDEVVFALLDAGEEFTDLPEVPDGALAAHESNAASGR